MAYFITSEGIYYEAEYKIQPTDISVSKRPSKHHHNINGKWISSDPSIVVPADDELPEQDYQVNVHKVRVHPNPNYIHHPYEPMNTPVYQPRQEVTEKQPKEETTLNSNTKVMFGVRELLMVGAFVVTATISWQDTNARIVKLEESKAVESVDAKVKMIEADFKALDKQIKADKERTDQTIRELEQILFSKKQKG